MTNLLLYRRVLELRDTLENHDLDEYPKKTLLEAEGLINQVFQLLDRRKL